MKLTRALSAGVIDSGFASLATFALNLYAINRWDTGAPEVLGLYFLFMSAFFMASAVPYQLLYIPAEKRSLEIDEATRVKLMNGVLARSLPIALGSGALVSLATIPGFASGFSWSDQVPFLLTGVAATVFSPMQNYARRLLFLAGRGWSAAAVSMVQFVVAVGALVTLLNLETPSRWIPIGALAMANIISLGTAIAIAVAAARKLSTSQVTAAEELDSTMGTRRLATSGRWLMTTGLMSTGNNFVIESIISLLAGPVALGLAGAAKTVAQPIMVLANGLRSVLGPRSMKRAADHDRPAARRVTRLYAILTALAVVAYIGVAGFNWALNPLTSFVTGAYSLAWLVPVSIIAAGFNSVAFAPRMELIGADREADLMKAEVGTNAIQLAVATAVAAMSGTVANAGAFARPIGFGALGISRLALYDRALDNHYASAPPPVATPEQAAP